MVLNGLTGALAWLGRQGTRALAISVFIGIAVPPLASLFKPMFTGALMVLLFLAFLRVHPKALQSRARQPALVIAAIVWIMIVLPIVAGFGLTAFGLDRTAPGLFVGLMLNVIAPPAFWTPALAALLGLEPALSLAVLIAGTVITPVAAAAFAALFFGAALTLSPLALGLRLLAMLGGAAILAAIVRRFAGEARVARQRELFDGLNVATMVVFAIGAMDGVTAHVLAQPLLGIGLVLLTFTITVGLGVVTALLFIRAGRTDAFALALAGGSRNMGLMLAAAAGAVPDLTWLYFAIAQLPIYLLPHLLRPIARRIARPHPPC